MKLTRDQVNTIIKTAPPGSNTTKLLDGLISRGYELEGVDTQQALANINKKKLELEKPQEPNYFQRVGQDIKQGFQSAGQDIMGTDNRSALSKGISAVSNVASAIASPINEAPGIKQVGEVIGKGVKLGGDVLSNIYTPEFQQKLANMSEEDYRKFTQPLQDVAGTANIAGTILAAKGAQKGTQLAKEGLVKTGEVVKGATNKTIDATKNIKTNVIKTLSPDIDDSVKTVLEKTDINKFDDFVNTAKNNAADNTKPSVYEKVADNMSKATEQISGQTKSLSQQKNAIISKAKNGLTDFTKETGQTILDINRTLKDSAIAKTFIQKLKTVKTKIDADRVIDDLQDTLYKGKKDMTIPVGSIEERALSSIIGKYNSKLKAGLPEAYSKINAEIADRLSTLDDLNRALGEVVDGVPIRGAGLVKQFFSPAGTKAKQLFKFVQDKTGINLAEDATLAKYIGEAFGDAKVKSLLEGLPTSRTGVLDKALDFTLEKTGVNRALRSAKQEGMLQKAKGYLKSNKNNITPKTTPKTPIKADRSQMSKPPIINKANISTNSTTKVKKSKWDIPNKQGGFVNLEEIAKMIDNGDRNIMFAFNELVLAGKKVPKELAMKAQKLADLMELESAIAGNRKLAEDFQTILDIQRANFKKTMK